MNVTLEFILLLFEMFYHLKQNIFHYSSIRLQGSATIHFMSLHSSSGHVSLLSEISFKHFQSINWKQKNMAYHCFYEGLPKADLHHYWSCDAIWWYLGKRKWNSSRPWDQGCSTISPRAPAGGWDPSLPPNSQQAGEAGKWWDLSKPCPTRLGLYLGTV